MPAGNMNTSSLKDFPGGPASFPGKALPDECQPEEP